MTEVQGAMTGLISLIAHPPEVLDSANAQHRRLLAAVRRHDDAAAAREMTEHLRGHRAHPGRAAPADELAPTRTCSQAALTSVLRAGVCFAA